MHQPIIPGLPDHLAIECLARLSHGYHGLLETVSKRWKDVIRSEDYLYCKARKGCGDWMFVLTEGSHNQWIAYDPEADRWHPLPLSPKHKLNDRLVEGFSCVCVNEKFLVIGGSYSNPRHSHDWDLTSDEVVQFDPFKNEWSSCSSMATPRSQFACCAIDGKIYVAGGRNTDSDRGLNLAEVYDPFTDKWENLPPMPMSAVDCIGIPYKGNFHVLSDYLGLQDRSPTQVFDPLTRTWHIKHETWPFSRARQVAVQATEDGRVYTVEDWGESIVKMRDAEKEEWSSVGKVPTVFIPNHSRKLEVFDYGFAVLGQELYVMGGKVLKWEESGQGRFAFDVVKLDRVRVCDPTNLPLSWRETRPMCLGASASILGCASLKGSKYPSSV